MGVVYCTSMRKTVVDIIRQISDEVEDRQLPFELMVQDIQMMQFKIRSVIGDISSLQTSSGEFIQALWRIGKIDEIVQSSLAELGEDDQEALLSYFKDIESQSRRLIRGSFNQPTSSGTNKKAKILKLEIFKDMPVKSSIH